MIINTISWVTCTTTATTAIINKFVRDKLNPHHHHPRDKLTERKRYLSKSREAIFEKVEEPIFSNLL